LTASFVNTALMELIKKKSLIASWCRSLVVKEFYITHGIEAKILFIFLLLGMSLFSYRPSLLIIRNLASVTSLSSDSLQAVSLLSSERLNLREMVTRTMSYSYPDTHMGFHLKNLTFFDSNSKLDAERKVLASIPRSLSKNAKKYVRAVFKISEKHQVDPIWILSVMWTESHFDYSAQSWAGARGLMQIMPATRTFINDEYHKAGFKLAVEGKDFNINEYFPYRVSSKERPDHISKIVNIELGIIYLKRLLTKFKNHKHATVAYNMGPGWTRGRLKRNLPVGHKNEYLDKVRFAYEQIVRKI